MSNRAKIQWTLERPHILWASIGRAVAKLGSIIGVGLLLYGLVIPPPAGSSLLGIAIAFVAVSFVLDTAAGLLGIREISTVFELYESASVAKAQTETSIAETTAAKAEMERLFATATAAKVQTDELFAMTDMLQSAEGYDDATAVLAATSLRLIPELGGSLYIFNNSRDRLDLAGGWNLPENFEQGETLSPGHCWALKSGKPHLNDPRGGTLCCSHHSGALVTLEIPMMARGAVHGLLTLVTPENQPHEALLARARLGQALADSMSLALSNISLREKLRTQSLRDPLTGLYNRRYMEDSLERYVGLADRTGGSTAVLMVDLDNFKLLNDQQGHAKGDAVLRDVAVQLVGGLRPTDVACRYGGEELMVILPGCSLEDAHARAEALRIRIESLSEAHQTPVSASIGVAAIPETSTTSADLVPMADNALYEAKRQGKNRVVSAARRAGREESQPRLVTA